MRIFYFNTIIMYAFISKFLKATALCSHHNDSGGTCRVRKARSGRACVATVSRREGAREGARRLL
jgi:hypothetical protein